MLRITALKIISLLVLTGCYAPNLGQDKFPTAPANAAQLHLAGTTYSIAPLNPPSSAAADTFARVFLNEIQPRSITEGVEYCGFFFITDTGQIFGTPPVRGRRAGCDLIAPEPGQGVFASYHTHGAYSPAYASEVPSLIDLQGDFQLGIDGYVSTPAGRVWVVEFQTRSTAQICGRNCVYADPNYDPRAERSVAQSYTMDELRQRRLSPS